MLTESGDHWLEGDNEVTIGIQGQAGNWIVTLRRGEACLASSQGSNLAETFAVALESSAKIVQHLAH